MKPTVSILMPVYNGAAWLDESITSCVAQTFSDWELVCVDDCSTDNSREVLSAWTKRDSRIRVFYRDKNGGICKAYETALSHACGKWVALLDQDDMFGRDYLCHMIRFAHKHNSDLVQAKYYLQKNEGQTALFLAGDSHLWYPSQSSRLFLAAIGPYKFFQKKLYKHVIFPEGMTDWADTCVSFQISCNAENPSVTTFAPYIWRIRKESVSHLAKNPPIHWSRYMCCSETITQFLKTSNQTESLMVPHFYCEKICLSFFLINWSDSKTSSVAFARLKALTTKIMQVPNASKLIFRNTSEWELIINSTRDKYIRYCQQCSTRSTRLRYFRPSVWRNALQALIFWFRLRSILNRNLPF